MGESDSFLRLTISWFQSLRGLGVGWNLARLSASRDAQGFQSLRGLGVGWNSPNCRYRLFRSLLGSRERAWSWLSKVSIPERVSGFQSLRGLGVGWNHFPYGRYPREGPPMFQSLRGLGVGWNFLGLHRLAVAQSTFQSLRGLGVGWNARAAPVQNAKGCFNP
jgi:hypothetical protein